MMVLGCKVNDYEATYVRENMNRYFTEVDFKEKADIYLIFTCCVTNTAEAKTRKFIQAARRNNPQGYIAAIGCLSQIRSDSEVFEDVDLIIGSDSKDRIVDLVREGVKMNNVHAQVSDEFEHLYIESYPTKSRSFLKIQDGCNQFCSYCVIPYSRGRERSADHDKILEEAKILAGTNKEIVLTGIHTGRYNDGEYDLARAVELIQQNSRHYAKRQMTWFRRDKTIHWLNANDSYEKNIHLIDYLLRSDSVQEE